MMSKQSTFKPSRSGPLAVAALLIALAGQPALAVDTTVTAPRAEVAGPNIADAQAEIKQGHFDLAIAVLGQVIAAEPRNADALNLMGYSLRKSGALEQSLSYYLKALKLQPKHLGANEYLGELYVQTGQLDKASERLAVLQGACGNCEQAQDLAGIIAKAQ